MTPPQGRPGTPIDATQAQAQALRTRRDRMATATSLMVIGVMLAASLLGMLSTRTFFVSASAILLCILAFYGAFRFGFNRRFADPSLTLPQMTAASVVVLCTMYAAESGRAVFAMLLLMVFLFGVLRFSTKSLLAIAVLMLAGYAAVIALLWRNASGNLDLRLEFLQWLVLALALPWFAWMGGYIRELRTELQRRNLELTEALRAAQASEANLEEAQHIARIGMWMVDADSRSTTWSSETFRLFEINEADGVPRGAELMKLIHPEDAERYNELIRPAIQEGRSFDSEFRIRLSSGNVRWLHALGRPVLDAEGRTLMVKGTLRDITEQREADEHIRRLAHFDGLTGLPNRSLFTQLLSRALAQAQRRGTPLAVLFIDLDGFKEVNDRLGHDAGDALLAAFASRLTAALRRSDATGRMRAPDSAARLGGDEFVVLIDDFAEPSQVEVVARRILSVVATPFQLGSPRRIAAAGAGASVASGASSGPSGASSAASVGASIGIALFPRDGDSLDSLMRCADEAMYVAKQAGKNTYRFCSGTDGAAGS